MAKLILCSLFFAGPFVHAFDILPEYQGITEGDLTRFDKPTEIDSEYQIIRNGFDLPLGWERRWQLAPRAFDMALGSLSNKYFLSYSRLKLEAKLLESLTFHFTYFAQRDFEVDQTRHILELSQRVTDYLRINLYGDPSHYKRENDMGLALLIQPSERWHHRIYYTMHDIGRAEHNDLPDHFDKGASPNSMGWTGMFNGEILWLRAGLRYDQPAAWIRPQEQRIFSYNKKLAFVDGIYHLDERHRAGVRMQWDSIFKGQEPDAAASPVPVESWRYERLQSRVQYEIGHPDDLLNYETAFTHVHRRWTNHSGQRMEHYNELPSVAVSIRGTLRADGWDRLRFEYEHGWYSRFGDLSLAPNQKAAPTEARLQAAYEWALIKKGKLQLALNFDMDQWTPVPTFEGGNGKFQIEF